MARQQVQVQRFAKLSEQTWATTSSNLNVASVDITTSLQANKDSFRITLQNQNKDITGQVGFDDRIKISLFTGASPTSSDIVIDGIVTEIDTDLTSGGRKIVIRGANRTQELLSNLVLVREVDETKNVSDIITQVLNQVNNQNVANGAGDQRHITFDSSTIAQTKSDSSAFPNKVFISNYKSAYDFIEQISDDEYTGDGQYIFYLDSTNTFYWIKKTSVAFSGLTLTEGIDIETLSVKKGKFNIFNSVIMDVGKDAYGNGNHLLQINTVSILQTGAKWKFLDESTISANLLIAEKNANPSSFTDADNFPTSYNYSLQFQWDSDGDGIVDTNVVTSDADYNKAIRQQARILGRQRAQSFLTLHGDVSIKATVQINGTVSYGTTQVVQLTSPTANLTSKELRIQQVSHAYSNSGWKTILELEEDTTQ